MVSYPYSVERDDNGTLLVSFPDFPEAHTFGEDEADVAVRAVDALATVVDAYIRARRPLPEPSRTTKFAATLPALMSTKADIYRAMLRTDVSKSELAKRLHWHPPQIDRLLDMTHGSRLDQLEAAATALGGHLEISIAGIQNKVHRPVITAKRFLSSTQRTAIRAALQNRRAKTAKAR